MRERAYARDTAARRRARRSPVDDGQAREWASGLGNSGLARLVRGGCGRALRGGAAHLQRLSGNRSVGTLVQREKGVEEAVEKTTATQSEVASALAAVGEAPGLHDTGAGEAAGAFQVGWAAIPAVAELGLNLKKTIESGRAIMAPKSASEQEEALAGFHEGVLAVHGGAAESVKEISEIVEKVQKAAEGGERAAEGGLSGAGLAAAVAAPISGYLSFSQKLLGVGTNLMGLYELEELQFSGWDKPGEALAAAKREKAQAERVRADAKAAHDAAAKAGGKHAAFLATAKEHETFLEAQLKDARKQEEDRRARGRPPSEISPEDAFAVDLENARRNRAEAERTSGAATQVEQAAAQALAEAEQRVDDATKKEKARADYEKFVSEELEKRGRDERYVDKPEHRFVRIEEIWQYAMARRKVGAGRAAAGATAAMVGLVVGVFGLALGWTPVGWALAAAAGAVGLGILAFKAGKYFLRKAGWFDRSDRDVYAERLYDYAAKGFTPGKMSEPDEEMKTRLRTDARLLVRTLGVEWSAVERREDMIKKIADKMKAG
jgi:hypothetical protein